MKMQTLITVNNTIIDRPNFQDARLQKATDAIIKIYTDAAKYADTKNRELAKILATVQAQKSYEMDGFTSLADYANFVFGIKKANAHALATAGRIYNDPKSPAALKELSPSNLYELSRVDEKDVTAALKSGEISTKSTQKQLREFAQAHAPVKEGRTVKNKPEPKYTIRVTGNIPDVNKMDLNVPRTEAKIDQIFFEFLADGESVIETIPLPAGFYGDSDAKVKRKLYTTSDAIVMVWFFKLQDTTGKEENPVMSTDSIAELLDEQEGG